MEGEVRVSFVYGGKATGDNKTDINTKTGKIGGNKNTDEDSKSLTVAYVYAAKKIATTTKQLLIDEALYESNKFFDLTDNVQNQRNLNIAKTNIQRATSIIGSTVSGAMVGGNAGPVGAIIGAVVGFVAGVAQKGVDIYQGYDQQNIDIRQREQQLSYTRQRVGYSLTVGSNGENR